MIALLQDGRGMNKIDTDRERSAGPLQKKNHTEADKGIEPQYLHHVHRPLSEQLDPKKASREIKTHSGRGAK